MQRDDTVDGRNPAPPGMYIKPFKFQIMGYLSTCMGVVALFSDMYSYSCSEIGRKHQSRFG